MEQGRKRRVRSFWLGGFISLAVVIIGLVAIIPNGVIEHILIAIAVGILTFPFMGCIFLNNNFVGGMVGSIFEWGFVKFPGVIFSLDLNGIFCFLLLNFNI